MMEWENKLYQILLKGQEAEAVVDDWVERVLAAIVKVKPSRVVYVSCNPATLARDLAYLNEHGFKVEKVQPCDMFSRTHHVESVVLMSRLKD